jgi:hypothetical protein
LKQAGHDIEKPCRKPEGEAFIPAAASAPCRDKTRPCSCFSICALSILKIFRITRLNTPAEDNTESFKQLICNAFPDQFHAFLRFAAGTAIDKIKYSIFSCF